MFRARKLSRDPARWPWDQATRNRLLAFMLWLTSKYRWHVRTYLRAVSVLDRVAGALPRRGPSLEYHGALLGLTAMSVAYKFEEGCPTDRRWVPLPDGSYKSTGQDRLWRELAGDFNACVRLAPPLTPTAGARAELVLLRLLGWDLHYDLPLHAVLRAVPTGDHRMLFRIHLLVRTASFLTAPGLDVAGLVQAMLAGSYAHPAVPALRAWLATSQLHPVLQQEQCYLRQDFPRLFEAA